MPKQLEILVTARDQASGVFRQVGDSAEGLSGKLGGLNQLAETGHGMHSMLRMGRNLFAAFEVIPVAIESVKAAYATLHGTSEEAAEGQRALFNQIKEIPLVGKHASEAAEWLGATISHALGHESTADIEAETAKKKQVLEDFAKDMDKLGKELAKSNDQAGMLGLLPGEGEFDKAKDEFKHKMDDLRKVKADAIKRAGEDIEGVDDASSLKDWLLMSSGDVEQKRKEKLDKMRADLEQADADIAQEEANQKKILAYATAEAHAKELDEENRFSEKLQEAHRRRAEMLESLSDGLTEKELEADNRGFEARQANLKSQTEKEIRQVLQLADAQRKALEEEAAKITPQAAGGGAAAQKRLEAIKREQAQNEKFLQQGLGAAQDAGAERLSLDTDEQLRQSKLKILQDEAAAGDASAKTQLQKLDYDRQMDATEKALLAIVKDTASTDQQRIEAKRQLNELDKAGKEHAAAEALNTEQALRRTNLELLEKEAATGDLGAAAEVQRLERLQQNVELRKQLQAMEAKAPDSKEGQEAHRQLAGLDKLEGQQADADLREANLELLQKEGQLGDENAQREVRKLELQKQFNAERAKLLAIEKDAKDPAQREQAKQLLGGLDAAQKKAEAGLGDEDRKKTDAQLDAAKLELLQKQAALGDKAAASEARKLELQKQYNEERQKLLAIENDNSGRTTKAERDQAKGLLAGLDATQKKAEAGLGGGTAAGTGKEKEGGDHRATLEAAQYLHGVSARGAQDKEQQFAPVVAAQHEQTGIFKTMAGLLAKLAGAAHGNRQPTYVR